MKNELTKRLTLSIVTLVFVLTTVFTNLTFAATPNINSNVETQNLSNSTDNRVVYTYLPKTYFEEQFKIIGGIDAIKNNHAVILTNNTISSISNAIKKTAPEAVTLGIIRSNVIVNCKSLRKQLIQASAYDDWCIILTTNYSLSKYGTSTSPTYDKLESIKVQYEVGQ